MVQQRQTGSSERGRGQQRTRFDLRGRQSFIDILGTVLRYVLIIVLIMAIVRYASEAYRLGYEVFSNEAMASQGQGQEVTVEITDGMSDKDVGKLLEEDGLIRDARVFPLQVLFSSNRTIVPGTYTLSTEMTTDEILKTLTEDDEESTDSSTAAGSSTSSPAASESTTEGT